MRSNRNAGEWSGTPERGRLLLVRDRRLDRLRAAGDRDAVAVPKQLVEGALLEIAPRESGDERLADVQRLDRHRLAVGEPQPLRRRRPARTARRAAARPRRAPAGTTSSASVRLAGTIPRRRMSSVNEVIVSSCAIFGSLTNVPAPRRRTRWPSRTRSSSAARTVSRDMPRSALQLPLRRDRVADRELLDQVEHAAPAPRSASSGRLAYGAGSRVRGSARWPREVRVAGHGSPAERAEASDVVRHRRLGRRCSRPRLAAAGSRPSRGRRSGSAAGRPRARAAARARASCAGRRGR